MSAFGEDTFQLGERLTLNLGLRFDRNESISDDVPKVAVGGNETGETIPGLGTLFTWSNWSARLGLTYGLTEDSRTLLRASWGRFYQGAFAGRFEFLHPGNPPSTMAAYDPEKNAFEVVATFNPATDRALDPELGGPTRISSPLVSTTSLEDG